MNRQLPDQSMITARALATEDADTQLDFFAFTGTLWRGKWWIALTTAVFMLIGVFYAFSITPIYRATSVVMLETRQEQVVNIESVAGGLSADTAIINSEVEVLRSRELLGRVVDELDLVNDPEFNGALREPGAIAGLMATMRRRLNALFGDASEVGRVDGEAQAMAARERVINALLGNTSIRNVPLSLVFQITVQSNSPAKAAVIADMIAEKYIGRQLQDKQDATEEATEWLTGRVADLEAEVETAEARVNEFSSTTDLISRESLLAQERQMKDLRTRIEDLSAEEAKSIALIERLEAAQTPEEKAEAAGTAELWELLGRVDTPEAAQTFDRHFEQLLSRARTDLLRVRNQTETLRTSLEKAAVQVERQSADFIQLQQLQRESEASRLLYEHFLTRLKETSAQQGIQQADSSLLSWAVIPTGPSEPRKSLIALMAALLGLVGGAGLILVREARQHTFRTAWELEKTAGLSVIGQVPKLRQRARKDVLLYLATNPSSAMAEAVRNLRTSVLLSDLDNPPSVIGLTSSVPGEGKTTLSMALANNFANMGKRVLLIEGDIRRRTFTQYVGAEERPGLISVLDKEAALTDVVFKDDVIAADILVGEKTSVNAADIYSSARFGEVIQEARALYDVVIVDTPPVLVVPDARIILQHLDTMLFTVAWDRTQKTQVLEAIKLFKGFETHMGGLILNQISPKGMKSYGYGGAYGAYSSYGAKYYTID